MLPCFSWVLVHTSPFHILRQIHICGDSPDVHMRIDIIPYAPLAKVHCFYVGDGQLNTWKYCPDIMDINADIMGICWIYDDHEYNIWGQYSGYRVT